MAERRKRHDPNNPVLDRGGRRPVHRVYGLLDSAGSLKFIGADRADRIPQWKAIWRYRHQLGTNLARWLQTLDAEPRETVLLGSAVGLQAATARAVARLLSGLCGTIAEDEERGPRPRKVARPEPDGSLTVWPSREAAAKALGTSPPVVRDRIADGVLLDAGRG
jgi:hypothetical protein